MTKKEEAKWKHRQTWRTDNPITSYILQINIQKIVNDMTFVIFNVHRI